MLGLREKRCKFLEAGQFLGGRAFLMEVGWSTPLHVMTWLKYLEKSYQYPINRQRSILQK